MRITVAVVRQEQTAVAVANKVFTIGQGQVDPLSGVVREVTRRLGIVPALITKSLGTALTGNYATAVYKVVDVGGLYRLVFEQGGMEGQVFAQFSIYQSSSGIGPYVSFVAAILTQLKIEIGVYRNYYRGGP